MEKFFDFWGAALPWIAMGLLLAFFFAKGAGRKKNESKREDFSSEGIALGLCFGVAMATALHFNIGLGMIAGMALGLLIGSGTEKKSGSEKDGKADG